MTQDIRCKRNSWSDNKIDGDINDNWKKNSKKTRTQWPIARRSDRLSGE